MIVLSFVRFEERPGLSMQLLSIENLSLAAEVTVVLLLLSFAWPQKKTEHKISSTAGDSIGWEPAKFFFLQNCTHRGLYLNLWRKQFQTQLANSGEKPFHPPIVEDDDNSKIPAPWQDRLTHLLNRQGFDAILSAWQSVDGQHRGASCVSMITLSTYSDLTSAHGAMVTEQAVQRIGKQLSADVSNDSLLARYLPDRFVVLHFASTTAESQRAMSRFHERTLDNAFFQKAGNALHLPCNISILELEANRDVNATLDLLEEGIVEGERLGKAIVSREENAWTETPFGLNEVSTRHQPDKLDSQPNSSGPNPKESSISKQETPQDEPAPDLPNDISKVATSDVEDAQPASNDISAVASPDDIAALFAQINTQKSNTVASVPSSPGDLEKQPEPKVAASAPPLDSSEAATADDIAALFATVKPNAKTPAPPVTPETAPASPTPPASPTLPATPTPPATPTLTVADIDKTEVATADDIAALFQSVKPSTKPANTTASSVSPAETKPQPNATVKPVVEVDPNEAATADDIAALFATVKPTSKAAQAATPSTTPQKTETLEAAKPFAAIDSNEAASADDIAALFATVKPTAKPSAAPAPAPTLAKAAELSETDRAEPATADDIAALFATVKSAVKPETPSTPPKPASASAPTPASPIPTGEELSQFATADDIASLLAAIKPAAPAPSQTTKASEPASPAIPAGEQLSETASADDIAALFAAVKPSAQSNSPKQTTSAAPSSAGAKTTTNPTPIPQEDLSANASLDDIEALFAAMKK